MWTVNFRGSGKVKTSKGIKGLTGNAKWNFPDERNLFMSIFS
jgi:hypothetical protein